MKRPRIYGDGSKCRAAVRRYIRSADALIDQAEGERKRVQAAGPVGEFLMYGGGWPSAVERWGATSYRGLRKHLQDQIEDVLPVLTAGRPKPPPVVVAPGERPRIGRREVNELDVGVPWLRDAQNELRELQTALGVRRDVAKAAPMPARFDELHASGLVAEEVINDREREMRAPRTAKQLADAIGAAKELTEATLRAALNRLGESWKDGDGLPKLMKTWRLAVAAKAPPDEGRKHSLDNAHSALANLVTFLAEWRNSYGRGHGRPRYPKGLSPRHARLATDAAETCVRFIATTMDDLNLLPPLDQ